MSCTNLISLFANRVLPRSDSGLCTTGTPGMAREVIKEIMNQHFAMFLQYVCKFLCMDVKRGLLLRLKKKLVRKIFVRKIHGVTEQLRLYRTRILVIHFSHLLLYGLLNIWQLEVLSMKEDLRRFWILYKILRRNRSGRPRRWQNIRMIDFEKRLRIKLLHDKVILVSQTCKFRHHFSKYYFHNSIPERSGWSRLDKQTNILDQTPKQAKHTRMENKKRSGKNYT
jgi:hypothetical protein